MHLTAVSTVSSDVLESFRSCMEECRDSLVDKDFHGASRACDEALRMVTGGVCVQLEGVALENQAFIELSAGSHDRFLAIARNAFDVMVNGGREHAARDFVAFLCDQIGVPVVAAVPLRGGARAELARFGRELVLAVGRQSRRGNVLLFAIECWADLGDWFMAWTCLGALAIIPSARKLGIVETVHMLWCTHAIDLSICLGAERFLLLDTELHGVLYEVL